MKTFNIVGADVITPKSSEPFVGLTVTVNGTTVRIARTCKQAVLDLHKSARGNTLPEKMFDNGYASANPALVRQFANDIIGLVGKTGIGDITPYLAGEEYEATADSRKVKAGEASIGDILKADSDGCRVEGFLSFPLSSQEVLMDKLVASAGANLLAQMLGLNLAPAPVVVETPATPFVATPVVTPELEAIGKAPKAK